MIRVLCIDDHPLILAGVRAMLEAEADMCFAGGSATGEEGLRVFREERPDVTLIDLRLSDPRSKRISGIETIAAICGENAGARVLALTAYKGDDDIHRALAAGARGYLLKDVMHKELTDAIRKVHAGGRWIAAEAAANLAEHSPHVGLTARELEVLRMLADGGRGRDTAAKLRITEDTVRFHLKSIFGKLGVNDRAQAITTALKRGILHLD